jgi:hypothetical protein
VLIAVYLNGQELSLPEGMKVRHALTQAGLLKEIKEGKKAYDQYGNEVGLDGALSPGSKIFVR